MKYFLYYIFSALIMYYVFYYTEIGASIALAMVDDTDSVELYKDLYFIAFSPFILLIFIFLRFRDYFFVYDESESRFANAVGGLVQAILSSVLLCFLVMPWIVSYILALLPEPISGLVL